jgi:hypothetical protein
MAGAISRPPDVVKLINLFGMRYGVAAVPHKGIRKQFFSEEKNQKTFIL